MNRPGSGRRVSGVSRTAKSEKLEIVAVFRVAERDGVHVGAAIDGCERNAVAVLPNGDDFERLSLLGVARNERRSEAKRDAYQEASVRHAPGRFPVSFDLFNSTIGVQAA